MSTNKEKIASLFVAYFDRAAGKSGFDQWVSDLENGVKTYEEISAGFAEAPEFTTVYATMTDEEFVKAIYKNVLGRDGTQQGIQNQLNALSSDGVYAGSRSAFVAGFVDSAITPLDLTETKWDYLTQLEKDTSQISYDKIINKMNVSLYYTETLQEKTNIEKIGTDKQGNNIYNEAYTTASVILDNVTNDNNSLIVTKARIDNLKKGIVLDTIAPTISSIDILAGNYIPGSILDVVVTFSENIILSNTDSKLTIQIGDYIKYASFSSKTANSITYKYIVDDGISTKAENIKVTENSLILNNSTITDAVLNNASLKNSLIENKNAIVTDNKAPSLIINSAHYTSNIDKLVLNGTGFSSILEESESFNIDVLSRFDFTKLVWDIDGDYDTVAQTDATPEVVNVTFSNADVRLVQVQSDTQISIIFLPEVTKLETAPYYGNTTNHIDTIDILSGFVSDTIGNKTTDAIQNNITVGIDNTFYLTKSSIVTATSNNDTIYGSSENDTLYGSSADDKLYGLNGNDTIVGGEGADILSGGEGADKFVFSTLVTDATQELNNINNIDKIIDLSLNGLLVDKIDLDIKVLNVNTAVNGKVDLSTFITDINKLVNVSKAGFNNEVQNDISSTLVYVNSGELTDKIYLLVDVDANNLFTKEDFVVDITGATITNFNTDIFV